MGFDQLKARYVTAAVFGPLVSVIVFSVAIYCQARYIRIRNYYRSHSREHNSAQWEESQAEE